MKLVFIGTNSCIPNPKRNQNALAVIFENGQTVLLDCGESTQVNLMKCDKLRHMNIRHMFITHMHGDHCIGLIGLILLLHHDIKEKDINGQKVQVIGPKGIRDFIQVQIKIMKAYGALEKVNIIELDPTQPLYFLNNLINGVNVTAMRLEHGDMPCFGYYFKEHDRAGKLDADKAKAMGAQFAQMGQLKAGNDLTLEDGTVIRSADVVGQPIIGHSMALLQDTSTPTTAIEYLKMNPVEILVHEATNDKSMRADAISHGHSTSEMAGEHAKEIQPKLLVLTHFSARYRDKASDESDITLDQLAEEAKGAFGGKVISAVDYMGIESNKKGIFIDYSHTIKDPRVQFLNSVIKSLKEMLFSTVNFITAQINDCDIFTIDYSENRKTEAQELNVDISTL